MVYTEFDPNGCEIEVEDSGNALDFTVYGICYNASNITLNKSQVRELMEALKDWLEG